MEFREEIRDKIDPAQGRDGVYVLYGLSEKSKFQAYGLRTKPPENSNIVCI